MGKLIPSARLKVKMDTFFLPDFNGGVYFRNNVGSFRMEGHAIHQWIERLLPMFNGDHTLGELTSGLPDPYRDRVYEIAETLYQNGFVRDVSQDRPHQLSDEVLKKYASQIEFIGNFVDSSAHRFQIYRQAKVLAIGAGPFLVSLVSALIETGLSKFHILITDSDSMATNRMRLTELVSHFCNRDSEVEIKEIHLQSEGMSAWRETVQPFDAVLYVSQEGVMEELRLLHAICKEENRMLLPAMCLQQVGLAGPVVHPLSEGCWESAWRRIHQSSLCKDEQRYAFSSTSGALLANVLAFELLKTVTGVSDPQQMNRFFLLDLETLEGDWHSFLPHPFVKGYTEAERIQDLELQYERNSGSSEPGAILAYFNQLTSAVSGIFHVWEEGDLQQLPLAQCRVQAVNPMSKGPADLLPEMVCNGLTHEEARREAGLAGIEAYVSRTVGLLVEGRQVESHEYVGVGAGESVAEGVCRGLQKVLAEELGKKGSDQIPAVFQVQLSKVEDERCRYYLQALTTIQKPPLIGLGEEIFGFPVVWILTCGQWFGCVGLNTTLALRKVLQQAIKKVQNQAKFPTIQVLEVSSVHLAKKEPFSLVIPNDEEGTKWELLQSALQVLKRNRKQLMVFDLALETFMKKKLAGVFGVLLREGA